MKYIRFFNIDEKLTNIFFKKRGHGGAHNIYFGAENV